MHPAMNLNLPLDSSLCVISARRYGDAIINARLIHAAAQARPDIRWVIWTKPEFAPLFQLMGFDQIITSQFPIAGGALKFLKEGGSTLLKAIFELRSLKLNASIDFIGDAREAFLGSLIAGRRHHSPAWEESHWMHKLIWNGKIPFVQYFPIQTSQDRMYEIVSDLLSKLTGKVIKPTSSISSINHRPQYPPKIAFHPFSSQEFKAWPEIYWQQLSLLLKKQEIIPTVFCTESEESKAYQIFSSENSLVKIRATRSLQDLISGLKSIDLLVGVDSFLVHLASALGKKTIVINSGNLPAWWQPPNSLALGQSGACLQYPCSNEPSCLGTKNESQCIKSIEPGQVLKAIEKTLS
ncbi:glycosyltransferase family 9 protein [Polynucleobacter asymbioticus]|uniref:glycosyltransferase family 9 protein n=1 Tax=Polynucleobacter asymbioticus TaxID=576611 RepID=UPI0015A5B99B|nr:glycosyltransferase family 9 protein [Polynucleobacter asymbioticus]